MRQPINSYLRLSVGYLLLVSQSELRGFFPLKLSVEFWLRNRNFVFDCYTLNVWLATTSKFHPIKIYFRNRDLVSDYFTSIRLHHPFNCTDPVQLYPNKSPNSLNKKILSEHISEPTIKKLFFCRRSSFNVATPDSTCVGKRYHIVNRLFNELICLKLFTKIFTGNSFSVLIENNVSVYFVTLRMKKLMAFAKDAINIIVQFSPFALPSDSLSISIENVVGKTHVCLEYYF